MSYINSDFNKDIDFNKNILSKQFEVNILKNIGNQEGR